MDRRDFFRRLATGGAAAAVALPRLDAAQTAVTDRAVWVSLLRRLADPVLTNLANETLKARMPVEEAEGSNRQGVTHLEAIGRLVAGIAPWLEAPGTFDATYGCASGSAAISRTSANASSPPAVCISVP